MSRKENIPPTIIIVPGMEEICGRSIMMTHYHYFMVPNPGYGKCELNYIPFDCVEFIDHLDHEWIPGKTDSEQPIYDSVT